MILSLDLKTEVHMSTFSLQMIFCVIERGEKGEWVRMESHLNAGIISYWKNNSIFQINAVGEKPRGSGMYFDTRSPSLP